MAENSQDRSGDQSPRRWFPRLLAKARARIGNLLVDNTIVLGLGLVFGLVVILATAVIWNVRGGDGALVGTVTVALLAMIGAMLPLIRSWNKGEEKPLWPPLIVITVPIAVLLIEVVLGTVWIFESNRSVDLTHKFLLQPAGPIGQGTAVTAKVHTNHPRKRLFIKLDVSQHDPAAPVCAPGSTMTVRLQPDTGNNGGQSGGPGKELKFYVGKDRKDILLSIQVRSEPNCLLDLSITSARLDD